MIKPLKWDSDFFKRNIGKLELLESMNSEIDASEFELIYVTQSAPFEVVINNFEETYSGGKIIFSKFTNGNGVTDFKNISSYSSYKNSNLSSLYKLAMQSGRYSRFREDSKFNRSEFQALYKSWIDNSLSKKIADEILIYSVKNEILGFVSYKVDKRIAKIGLLAVAPEVRGLGIGSSLILKIENLSSDIEEIEVETQEKNVQACLFYKKNAFFPKKKVLIKHFWKNDSI